MFKMQSRVKLWVFLGFIRFCTVTTVFNSPDGKTCYGNICLDEDYDPDIWPSRKGGDPIIVDMCKNKLGIGACEIGLLFRRTR